MSKRIFSRIIQIGGARVFTVGLAVLLAAMLGVAAMILPPSGTAAFAHYDKGEIDYFALGDSIASGYGLPDATGDCLQSSKAYPYTVSDALKTRYQKVNFPIHEAADGSVVHHHLACSGARVTVDISNPVPTGSYKLLENQVDYVLKHLSANPTLVSITIGANDFGFSNEAKTRKHLAPPEWGGETEEDFRKWADKTALKVKEQLQPLVNRLLLEPNVVIVITDLYDPMNKKATKFWAAGVGEASVEVCRTCRSRLEYGLDKLNSAFVSMRDALASGLVNPARLQLTGEAKAEGIRAAFRGHEAPHRLPLTGSCGKASPGLDGTWIQPWPDCIHPNEKGAQAIAKAVNDAANRGAR